MLRSIRSLSVTMFACVIALPCLAASSPWDGTWKLNKEKSQLTGGTWTLAKDGTMYRMGDSSPFACDGKEYTQPDGRTLTCQESGNKLTTTTKQEGKTLWINERELQANGKTMKLTRTVLRPDGGKDTSVTTYARVGEGSDLVGSWKVAAVDVGAPQVWTAKVDGDSLHMELPAYKISWDGKLDGTPAPYKGDGAPAGVMMGIRTDGPSKLVAVETTNGRPSDNSEFTISPDGKTLTEVDWSPDKPDEKMTLVFEKQ